MKTHGVLFLIILFLCSCDKTSNNIPAPSLEHTFFQDVHQVNPGIRGVWKSVGNGYVLKANEDSILLYSYTKSYCYRDYNKYLNQLLNSTALFSKSNDTIKIFLHDFGEKTQSLQTNKKFVRIDQLPNNCLELSNSRSGDPKFLFDLFMESLEVNYAFTAERDLNWSNIISKYQPQITNATNPDSLFRIMGAIVILTKDHHTKIIAKDGKSFINKS